MTRGFFRKIAWLLLPVLANAFAYAAVRHLIAASNDTDIPPANLTNALALAALFSFATLLALTASVLLRRVFASDAKMRVGLIIASVAIFGTALYFPPIGSVDNGFNLMMARTLVIHGSNPYVTPAGTFMRDPVVGMTSPKLYGVSTVYGPLWTLLSAIPVLLTSDVLREAFLLRLMNAAGYVVAGFIIFRFLKKRDSKDAWLVWSFWLLNPIAVFEVANAGHNEGLMLPFIAVLAVALAERKLLKGSLAVVGAALMKDWPLILAPALLGIRAKNADRSKVILLSLVLFFGAWKIFWVGPETVRSISWLASNIRGNDYSGPFRYAIWSLAGVFGLRAPDKVASTVSCIGLLVVIVTATVQTMRKKISPLAAAFLITLAYHFLWLNWLEPWYFISFLPLLTIFFKGRRASLIAVALGIVGMCTYVTQVWLATSAAALDCLILMAIAGPDVIFRLFKESLREPETEAHRRPADAV